MTTTADLVHDARDLVAGKAPESSNVLAEPYVAGSGEITLRHSVAALASGTRLEIGYTEVTVLEANPGTKVVAIYVNDGTTDRDYPAGTLVVTNPRLPAWRAISAFNAELSSLSSPRNGLYRTEVATDLTALPEDTIKVLDVLSGGASIGAGGWRFATSTNGIEFTYAAGDTAVVALPFDPLPQGQPQVDVAETTGLPATACDLLALGAAIAVLSGREGRRALLDTQGDTRRPEEVPPQTSSSLVAVYERRRRARIAEEAARLLARYGLRR